MQVFLKQDVWYLLRKAIWFGRMLNHLNRCFSSGRTEGTTWPSTWRGFRDLPRSWSWSQWSWPNPIDGITVPTPFVSSLESKSGSSSLYLLGTLELQVVCVHHVTSQTWRSEFCLNMWTKCKHHIIAIIVWCLHVFTHRYLGSLRTFTWSV